MTPSEAALFIEVHQPVEKVGNSSMTPEDYDRHMRKLEQLKSQGYKV